MILPDVYTIGVYGSNELDFFKKLVDNKIDLFCDIRRRRAVRGSQYSFVNSKKLQQRLQNLSIKYHYEISLAPTKEIRELQKKVDEINKVQKRQREELGDVFKIEYSNKILENFDIQHFFEKIALSGTQRIVFFCVEKLPEACHRSLVTNRLKHIYPDINVTNLV